jgi:hypothetical protein
VRVTRYEPSVVFWLWYCWLSVSWPVFFRPSGKRSPLESVLEKRDILGLVGSVSLRVRVLECLAGLGFLIVAVASAMDREVCTARASILSRRLLLVNVQLPINELLSSLAISSTLSA